LVVNGEGGTSVKPKELPRNIQNYSLQVQPRLYWPDAFRHPPVRLARKVRLAARVPPEVPVTPGLLAQLVV
jgi:hypothetical protein